MDENKDNSEEKAFWNCIWDFYIAKSKDQCGKKVWLFKSTSGVKSNFQDKNTWTKANWVGDRYQSILSICGRFKRRWGFFCSWFLIILLLVEEGECKKDDFELNKVEKPFFVFSSNKVLIFS